jgi:hypothetical protein
VAVTLNGKWIELFRAGDYGDKGSYNAADIDKMVANYDPAKHEAPVVMGHPEMDAPAYGWVEAVKRSGNVLLGKLKQVPDQFSKLVDEGRFKKRSISFYRGENGPSLRHVGFLGAMPPEVKGLADVKLAHFSAGDGVFTAIDFKEENNMDVQEISNSINKSLKEFFTELFKGKKIEDVGAPDNSKAIADAVAAATAPLQAKFSELSTQLDNEKKARETAAGATAAQTEAAFAEKQIQRMKDKKRWLPAFEKMGLPQIFAELSKVGTKISFGEGDKKVEKPAAEVFADFMIDLGEFVPTGELAGGVERRKGNLVQFTDPKDQHTAVDQDSVALAEAAKAMSAKEKIPYGDALRRVRASGEYGPGTSTAGSV